MGEHRSNRRQRVLTVRSHLLAIPFDPEPTSGQSRRYQRGLPLRKNQARCPGIDLHHVVSIAMNPTPKVYIFSRTIPKCAACLCSATARTFLA
jgi:hypothetical protein